MPSNVGIQLAVKAVVSNIFQIKDASHKFFTYASMVRVE